MSRPPKAVRDYMAALGKKGGETKGKSKARSPEHYARLADMKRKKQNGLERLNSSGDIEVRCSECGARARYWEAMAESLCWKCSRPQAFYAPRCLSCDAINPNVDLQGALAQQSVPQTDPPHG